MRDLVREELARAFLVQRRWFERELWALEHKIDELDASVGLAVEELWAELHKVLAAPEIRPPGRRRLSDGAVRRRKRHG